MTSKAPIQVIPPPARRKVSIWKKMGGGALTFAVIFHAILFMIGAIWILRVIHPPEKKVDFLSGNGQAGGSERGAQHQIQQKKRAQITPTTNVKRVFAEGASSVFAIPEQGDDFGNMSTLSSLAGSGAAGGGLGGSGGGKGFGLGAGSGLGSGNLNVKMFGIELEGTEKIAVVMDVSRSMTRHLPTVARELDKISATSPLVLYFGCGVGPKPRNHSKNDDRIRLANGPRFDRFWYAWQGTLPFGEVKAKYDDIKVDPKKDEMPLEKIYREMSNRTDTYFLEFNGIHYAQPALLCNEVREADTIYWFADFQDKVDEQEMKDVLRKLKQRRQKLVMHAPKKGKNFDILRTGLAEPSGGRAIVKGID